MKHALTLIICAAILAMASGCHAQPSPTPPLPATCPAAGNSAYTPLNAASSSATYTDTPPAGAQECYVASGVLPASGSTPAQTSSWSNIAGPSTGGATGKVGLSVTCTPTPGTTCTGEQWIFSRAPAVVPLAPAVPAVGAPTSSQLEVPNPAKIIAASNDALKLKAQGQ